MRAEIGHAPREHKWPLGAIVQGVQRAGSGGRLAQPVKIMGVVLQGAVVVAGRNGHCTEAKRQPDIVVCDRVGRRIHLGWNSV